VYITFVLVDDYLIPSHLISIELLPMLSYKIAILLFFKVNTLNRHTFMTAEYQLDHVFSGRDSSQSNSCSLYHLAIVHSSLFSSRHKRKTGQVDVQWIMVIVVTTFYTLNHV
jgi:hypothetical protein